MPSGPDFFLYALGCFVLAAAFAVVWGITRD
jgi:hypothetical protein